ncbi:GNAT family N-acetyltransferase [Rhodoferax sp. U2-2l]|uniref:GNAT family N-acetyltransferase n=1 Tax=Rhodoferax sp. U2-2l TaxID=2884000 RepID=UPI001D09A6CE|nr:GNAT family N-acetyltransferase [Rhodoferax sp. U2-2l]
MSTIATLSPDSITIRLLKASDPISNLTVLLHRAYARLAQQGLRYMATHQTDEVTRERVEQGECFVAVADEALCGTILFKEVGRTGGCHWYDRDDVACFGQFAVEPKLQANGLGRRLIALAEARAAATGAREIALDTAESATHLVSWYMRLGYRFIEHAQWTHTNYRSVIMSKTLQRSVIG